jgi:nucleotide-binding universal stress UspA family protein
MSVPTVKFMAALPDAHRRLAAWDAPAQDSGIVVMGSHGRTGISLVLIGSVAAAVARHTERPDLIVHTSAAAEAG